MGEQREPALGVHGAGAKGVAVPLRPAFVAGAPPLQARLLHVLLLLVMMVDGMLAGNGGGKLEAMARKASSCALLSSWLACKECGAMTKASACSLASCCGRRSLLQLLSWAGAMQGDGTAGSLCASFMYAQGPAHLFHLASDAILFHLIFAAGLT